MGRLSALAAPPSVELISAEPRRQPTFIDVFAGCRGLSLGLMAAGWKGLFAIERDRHAVKTLQANFATKGSKHAFEWPTWLPKQAHDIKLLLKKYPAGPARPAKCNSQIMFRMWSRWTSLQSLTPNNPPAAYPEV